MAASALAAPAAALGGAVPTLSQVRTWSTEHLTQAADYWTHTAVMWDDHFTDLAHQISAPGGTGWEGDAADAAYRRAHTDRVAVMGQAEQLHDAARVARTGAEDISWARDEVLRGVDAAQNAGFVVGEDFSVTRPGVYHPAIAAVLHAQAQAISADLRTKVGALLATDTDVAANLAAATPTLGTVAFPESAGPSAEKPSTEKPSKDGSTVRLVDFKKGPSNPNGTDGNDGGAHNIAKLPEQGITAVPNSEAIGGNLDLDPTNSRIGDPRFGYWEDVKLPYKPWVGDTPPPLTTEQRPFGEDIRDTMTAKPTEYFVPNKSWTFDNEAPYAQLQEQYRVRVSGTEATPYTKVVDGPGGSVQQRWVQYTYEVAHSRQVVLGGDTTAKEVPNNGDIGGLGPYRWLSQNWTPTSIADIAKLSASNPTTDFYIPDGCGGQFTMKNAVPVGPLPIGLPPSPPIMTRPS